MKLQDFNKLTYDDLNNLSTNDLKALVSEQGQKLNKRVSRLYSIKGPAYEKLMLAGSNKVQKFGVKNKNRASLIREAKREQRFYRSKTSTVKGAKEWRKNVEIATGGVTAEEYAKGKVKEQGGKYIEYVKEYRNISSELWHSFNRWKEANPGQGSPKDVTKIIHRAVESDNSLSYLKNYLDTVSSTDNVNDDFSNWES